MVEKEKAQAFKTEYYENATQSQITDDIVSYLGEYRFKVSEFNYSLGFENGRLTDPNSKELMASKAKSAIKVRQQDGLNSLREESELNGILSLENQLIKNPNGTIVWFSPPGNKEDGYGNYGFGYVGKLKDNQLEMTAIRLEDPSLKDFNKATGAIWQEVYIKEEEFLQNPRVVDISKEKLLDFIHGNFEIKDKKSKEVFDQAMNKLKGVINDYSSIIKNASQQEKHIALHVVENLSIELKQNLEESLENKIVYVYEQPMPDLRTAMTINRYVAAPPVVYGSCGISGKKETNDIFRSLTKTFITDNKSRDFDFDQDGPCRLCGKDSPCGPCKICESCNDKIDINEFASQAA